MAREGSEQATVLFTFLVFRIKCDKVFCSCQGEAAIGNNKTVNCFNVNVGNLF